MTGRVLNCALPASLAFGLLLLGLTFASARAGDAVEETYGGREMLVTVPAKLPPPGARALVVVLHGGLGNAGRIESRQSETGMNLDTAAEQNGFIVAYLNGTKATRFLGGRVLAWNAGGGCCGQPAKNNVDDVAYIEGAVDFIAAEHGIDRSQVYGIGHSNGAMMVQRLLCETKLLAAAVAISGPLNIDAENCPGAGGRRILAIQGAKDENVPLQGGPGTKGVSRVAYKSEERSQKIFEVSGASYTLDVVAADHKFDDIDAALEASEGVTIAQKSLRFFGLLK
jgi:polyhydroxybutyrate depolymerase